MSIEIPDFDVGVIGGGPAGAAVAAYLARAGVRCVVLERELFPRPHVGESLVPSSTRVFKDLGFLEKMEEAKFPHKYGAVWTSASSKEMATHSFDGVSLDEASIRFAERDQPGVERPYTYHVDRGKFDLLLLQHAHALGATVYEGIRVLGVDFSGALPQIQFKLGRTSSSISVRLVIDASGRHTLLGNQLRLKVKDPVFDQFALHTWFEGFDRRAVARGADLDEYIFVHFLPTTNTWMWQIPISPSVTSIGVVTQKRHVEKAREAREEFFWKTAASRPELEAEMRKAVRIRPFKDEGDYSYSMKQICGDGFVLIGDAARFVDPIFSTGVSIALNSARFVSADVLAGLERGDVSKAAFGTYESTIRRGTQNWYDFISVYYRLNILFTRFVSDKKHRLDVLKLLQGDVYDEERPAVLQKMRDAVLTVERDPSHPWHAALGDLTGTAFAPLF